MTEGASAGILVAGSDECVVQHARFWPLESGRGPSGPTFVVPEHRTGSLRVYVSGAGGEDGHPDFFEGGLNNYGFGGVGARVGFTLNPALFPPGTVIYVNPGMVGGDRQGGAAEAGYEGGNPGGDYGPDDRYDGGGGGGASLIRYGGPGGPIIAVMGGGGGGRGGLTGPPYSATSDPSEPRRGFDAIEVAGPGNHLGGTLYGQDGDGAEPSYTFGWAGQRATTSAPGGVDPALTWAGSPISTDGGAGSGGQGGVGGTGLGHPYATPSGSTGGGGGGGGYFGGGGGSGGDGIGSSGYDRGGGGGSSVVDAAYAAEPGTDIEFTHGSSTYGYVFFEWCGPPTPTNIVVISTSNGLWYSQDSGQTYALAPGTDSGGSWYGVTYGDGKFVACNFAFGPTGGIYTSTDGITWTQRLSSALITAVEYNGSTFMALDATAGAPYSYRTSSDGIAWSTAVSFPGSGNYNKVRKIGFNSFVVWRQSSSTSYSRVTSDNGVTWQSQKLLPILGGIVVDMAWNGASRVGGVLTSHAAIYGNATGSGSWNVATGSPLVSSIVKKPGGGNILVGFGNNQRWETDDGNVNDWVVVAGSSQPSPIYVLQSMPWTGRYIGVGGSPSFEQFPVFSDNDGLNWYRAFTPGLFTAFAWDIASAIGPYDYYL